MRFWGWGRPVLGGGVMLTRLFPMAGHGIFLHLWGNTRRKMNTVRNGLGMPASEFGAKRARAE
jgi:hypothetical protein